LTPTSFAFDQNAGELGSPEQDIIRPLDDERRLQCFRALPDRVMERERRDKRKLRPHMRKDRRREQQARIEISGFRHPAPSAPSAARTLPGSHHPERSALSLARKIQCFCIGRAKHFMRDKAYARRDCPRIEPHRS
jgi:hypothetical protein